MKVAFTMDDLPLWPMSYPPPGYTAAGTVDDIIAGLAAHDISGVYAGIPDTWVDARHFIANHTHAHIQLPDVEVEVFAADIDTAMHALAGWMKQAPLQLFRHPLCHWGETAEKLAVINRHLDHRWLMPVDVTSWAYDWTWNRTYRNALDAKGAAAVSFVRESFLDFAPAQLLYHHAMLCERFGQDAVSIALAHNVPFFWDIATDYFARLKEVGAVFVPLEQALNSPALRAVGSIVLWSCSKSWQKLKIHQSPRLRRGMNR